MAEVRWHINESGVAGRCKAQPGECPIAPNAPHFETAADARAAYEESMEEASVAPSAQRAPKPMSQSEAVERKTARRAPAQTARKAGNSLPSHGGLSGHGSMSAQDASEAATAVRRRIVPSPGTIFGHGRGYSSLGHGQR